MEFNDRFVYFFTASWCGPCKRMYPVWQSLTNAVAEKHGEEFAEKHMLKFDVEEDEEMALKYKVSSMPTLILENDVDGRRITGAAPDAWNELVGEFFDLKQSQE